MGGNTSCGGGFSLRANMAGEEGRRGGGEEDERRA